MSGNCFNKIAMSAMLLACSLSMPQLAHALSCEQKAPVQVYDTAKKAGIDFAVVYGTLSYTEVEPVPLLDLLDQRQQEGITRLAASVAGKSLTANGFVANFEREIVVEVMSVASWSGKAPTAGAHLMFINMETEPPTIGAGPCGSAARRDR
ncbi:MAG: hypothetical protein AAFR13_06115, partial [Pseudomonadota bacterium]